MRSVCSLNEDPRKTFATFDVFIFIMGYCVQRTLNGGERKGAQKPNNEIRRHLNAQAMHW
jgi:hypothetical protein